MKAGKKSSRKRRDITYEYIYSAVLQTRDYLFSEPALLFSLFRLRYTYMYSPSERFRLTIFVQ